MHHRTRIALTALLSALALLTAACNGDTATAPDADAPPATGEAAYNDGDITFLEGMIPHHDQAVEMAELVPDRTDRTELQELAESIIASQEAEIDEMEQLLDDAGADTGGTDHDSDGMSGMSDMEGMMSDDEMRRLTGLEGTEFDLAFIDMMIEHHEGAITSAEQVINDGENPQVRQLAEEIIAEQEAEIDQMNTWREQWAAAGS